MKRFLAWVIVVVMGMLFCTAAVGEGEILNWNEHSVELVSIEKGGMFAPASMTEDEYCVSVKLAVDEELWNDETLREALYGDLLLTDAQGSVYNAGSCLSAADTMTYTFLYCIPNDADLSELSVKIGNEAQGDEGSDSVNLTTAAGDSIALTAVEAGRFNAQDDSVMVYTRVGTTVHNSGSQFLPGSAMSLTHMRSTKQYEMPMVSFAYETALDIDQAADAIEEIGKTAVFLAGDIQYPVEVAWITEDLACFIFDGVEISDEAPVFSVEDGKLIIVPR